MTIQFSLYSLNYGFITDSITISILFINNPHSLNTKLQVIVIVPPGNITILIATQWHGVTLIPAENVLQNRDIYEIIFIQMRFITVRHVSVG